MTDSWRGRKLRVVKFGGSLFDSNESPARFRRWLGNQTPLVTVCIAGGGGFAEVVRTLDKTLSLGDTASHWLCVQALTVSTQLLGDLLPDALGPLGPREIIELSDDGRPVLLDVPKLMELDTARSVRPLPASWDVTTDSIAARAAVLLEAQELVLLKSALPTRAGSLRELAEQHFVDAHFPICAKSLEKIRLVDLRHSEQREVEFITGRQQLP